MDAENCTDSLDDLGTETFHEFDDFLKAISQSILKSLDDIRADFFDLLDDVLKCFANLITEIRKTLEHIFPFQTFKFVEAVFEIFNDLGDYFAGIQISKGSEIIHDSFEESLNRSGSILNDRKLRKTRKERS